MTIVRTKVFRQVAAALTFAVSLGTLSSPGSAYTAEAQRLCMSDAFRLCSSEIPSIPRITACMRKNRSQLTPGCRAELDKGLAAETHKVAEE